MPSKLLDPSPTPDPIWEWRGFAIASYSGLEQSLCSLFEDLLGTGGEKAAIVFFKITNSQARNAILEKLIKETHGNEYNLFWNSYLKELRTIDIKRNEIVHWTVAINATNTEDRGSARLITPNLWSYTPDESPTVTVGDLREFSKKCGIFSTLITSFNRYVSCRGQYEDAQLLASWLQIFHEPLSYPLPEHHLIFQSDEEPESPPRPSPA